LIVIFAIDAMTWKDHHPADGVADVHERFVLDWRDLIDDAGQPAESRNHSIARQLEFAELGEVMQMHGRRGRDVELERRAARQRIAPQELVIPQKCWTVCVRVFPGRRVRSEVEGDVNQVDERKTVQCHGILMRSTKSHIRQQGLVTTATSTRFVARQHGVRAGVRDRYGSTRYARTSATLALYDRPVPGAKPGVDVG
jgi:hypothetical protein